MSTLLLGADAGGTKVELLAEPADGTRRTLFGPACNLQRIGQEAAADVLEQLVHLAVAALPEPPERVVLAAGLAGAGHAADREALAERLRHRFVGAGFDFEPAITHDADIALEGAFGSGSGFIVIAGTGSVVVARATDGTLERRGGWGYLLGDEGSGYAVGLAALKRLAATFDGARPPSRLTRLLQDRLGLPDAAALVRWVYQDKVPPSEAARLVCEACRDGDGDARALLHEQADGLAAQVAVLARALAGRVAPRVSLLGGLTHDATYRALLAEAIHAAVLPDARHWDVSLLPCAPVEGALAMARRLAHAGEAKPPGVAASSPSLRAC